MLSLFDRSSVPLCSCSVDEIELIFEDTVVESFGMDAQSSFCLNTWGKGLSQVTHLKPLSIGERPPVQSLRVESQVPEKSRVTKEIFRFQRSWSCLKRG